MYVQSKLFLECHLAGFAYYDGLFVIDELKPGVELDLALEPDNPVDHDAVTIYYHNNKLGYVPKQHNGQLSQFLRLGYAGIFKAVINSKDLQAHPERQLRISIFLREAADGLAPTNGLAPANGRPPFSTEGR